MNKKFFGIVIKRVDLTIPPTKEEEKLDKRIPRTFVVRVNRAIPSTHKLCEGGSILWLCFLLFLPGLLLL